MNVFVHALVLAYVCMCKSMGVGGMSVFMCVCTVVVVRTTEDVYVGVPLCDGWTAALQWRIHASRVLSNAGLSVANCPRLQIAQHCILPCMSLASPPLP